MLSVGRNNTEFCTNHIGTKNIYILLIFTSSTQKALAVKPENAILAGLLGFLESHLVQKPGARSLEQQRYSLLLAGDSCFVVHSPWSQTVQFSIKQFVLSHQGPFQLEISTSLSSTNRATKFSSLHPWHSGSYLVSFFQSPILPRASLFEKPMEKQKIANHILI